MPIITLPSHEKYIKKEQEQLSKEYKAMRLQTANHIKYLIDHADVLNVDSKMLLVLCDIEDTLLSCSSSNLPRTFKIIDHAIAEFIYTHHLFVIRLFNHVKKNPSILDKELYIYKLIVEHCEKTGAEFKLFDSHSEYIDLLD
ncbi:MAG: hypothetical protein O2809_10110 [Proteobacteria bacterium]|nr:hypothetical protein [Pseudomonadota bacterium]